MFSKSLKTKKTIVTDSLFFALQHLINQNPIMTWKSQSNTIFGLNFGGKLLWLRFAKCFSQEQITNENGIEVSLNQHNVFQSFNISF